MKKKNFPRGLVLGAILDDLKHQHLVSGLNILGFSSDRELLDVRKSIFHQMDLNIHDGRLDYLVSGYADRAYKVTDFSIKDTDSFNDLATEIYNWLKGERKKFLKSNQIIVS